MRALKAGTCEFQALKYHFLDLFEATEPLNIPGKRLNDPIVNTRRVVYAPSVHPQVKVEERRSRLDASFIEKGNLEVASGECKELNMKILNVGRDEISRLWMVLEEDDGIFILPSSSEDAGKSLWPADHAR